MSTLVIQIPARPRRRARPAADEEGGSGRSTEYVYVTTRDGLTMGAQGQAAAALLPAADHVVAVLADADVSWHRIALPRAPAAKLRAALVGVLEDGLLEDADAVHLAVAPAPRRASRAGSRPWIASGCARNSRCSGMTSVPRSIPNG